MLRLNPSSMIWEMMAMWRIIEGAVILGDSVGD